MNSWSYRRKTCRLCDSADLECVVPLQPIPIVTPNVDANTATRQFAGVQASSVPLDLHLCKSCGHFQLIDVINADVQYNNFTYTTSISLGLPQHFRKFADEVIAAVGAPKNAFLVEVGSNDGTLLRAFKEKGLKVLGIDPAQKIAARATELGVKTLADFFTEKKAREMRAAYGAADIVVANNTFANIDDLGDFAAAIRALLAPAGVFIFETSYGADVTEKTLIDTVYHEHLSYFMVAPLELYFARHAMQLIDVQHIWTKGGSIRGIVQLAGGRRPRKASVDAMVADEKRRGLNGTEPYAKMNSNIVALQKQIAGLVSARLAAGKRMAGYGASVGTVTLINQFRLGSALEFVADDKPLCEYLAGRDYHIPVVSPEVIYERNPASIIVLAWRYADPIISKHRRYVAAGGEFIIPLPAVTIRKDA